MPARIRIDRLLVERGLFESRAKAQAAIAAGLVTADDVPITRPWRDRGGRRAARRARSSVGVARRREARRGARSSRDRSRRSRLSRRRRLDRRLHRGDAGARRPAVYAVDVGRDQLHPRLRGRPEIVSLEATDIRDLDPERLAERPHFVAVDVSFISLKLVLPAALALADPRAHLVALVKPQFETGGRHLKKGIVRDPAVHAGICADIADLIRSLGCEVLASFPSPILGGDGNREFFIGARRG